MNNPLDDQVRRAIGDILAAAPPVPPAPDFDDLRATEPAVRSRAPTRFALVALVALGMAGLGLLNRGSSANPLMQASSSAEPAGLDVSPISASSLFALDVDGWLPAQVLADASGTHTSFMRLGEMTDETGGPAVLVSVGAGLDHDPIIAADLSRLTEATPVQILGGQQTMWSSGDDTIHAVQWTTDSGIAVSVTAEDVTSDVAAELFGAVRLLTPSEADELQAERTADIPPPSTLLLEQ
jgi:hypothetical protein